MIDLIEYKGLIVPRSFLRLNPSQRKKICNGAGSKGFGWAVPDTFYGVSITRAADIHDYMYYMGFDKKLADQTFYKNMLKLVAIATLDMNWFQKSFNPLRKLRCLNYYLAVKAFGGGSYGRSSTNKRVYG